MVWRCYYFKRLQRGIYGEDNMKKIKYICFAFLAFAVIIAAGSYYFVDYAMARQDNDQDYYKSYQHVKKAYPQTVQWLDSLEFAHALKDTTIINRDGVRLHAKFAYAKQPTGKTAIMVHGYTDNANSMLMIGYIYSEKLGFNILLPDNYAHGYSEGKYIQMGWKDRLDIKEWLEFAKRLFTLPDEETRMVVHGISMGAATTMMLSGDTLKPYVKCFVEDCGYTSVWDEFKGELKKRFHIPAFPFLYTADWLNKIKNGWSFKEASALQQVRKCKQPMFFIHGDKDTFVPTSMVYELYEAKPEPKYLWVTQGTAHALSYYDYPEKYEKNISEFIQRYIP